MGGYPHLICHTSYIFFTQGAGKRRPTDVCWPTCSNSRTTKQTLMKLGKPFNRTKTRSALKIINKETELRDCMKCTYIEIKVQKHQKVTYAFRNYVRSENGRHLFEYPFVWIHVTVDTLEQALKLNIYEGCNFNSGNYLFTTDTK